MADLIQTPANVSLTDSSDTQIRKVVYGESVTQGMPVYRKASDDKYYKADKGYLANAEAVGIALTPGAIGEYGVIATRGEIDLGATLSLGETYVVSTAGAISPVGDLTTNEHPTILGIAITTASLKLDISVSGVTKA